jgi:hypothetical protein
MKVLLLGVSTTDPDYTAWQAALQREGVPFDTIIASAGHAPITTATLSDTLGSGTLEGKYEGIIVASAGLETCTTGANAACTSGLANSEWNALETYEANFHVRQIDGDANPTFAPSTAYDYGLNTSVTGAQLDGQQGTLTTDGKTIFPYLNGPVLFGNYPVVAGATTTYGYESAPLSTSNFDTLVTGPGNSALVGIFNDPNGVQQFVETYAQNESLMQAELLQHGALNWLTRGAYFGDQRNYVEMDIDDTFTPDDAWDATTSPGSIDYSDANALLMNPSDVGTSSTWEAANSFRLDQLFNFGSTVTYANSPAVLAAFQANCASNCGPGDAETGKPYADSFGWISHTYDTPYLDVGCATQNYIEAELNQNTSSIAAPPGAPGAGGLGLTMDDNGTTPLGGTEDPHVFVPGNHSGFANLVPGTPATVDPPILDSATPGTDATATLPAGTYEYAIADQFTDGAPTSDTTPNATGLSGADISAPITVTAGQSVALSWQAICHASDYVIWRGYEAPAATSYTWTQLAPATTGYGTVSTPFSASSSNTGNPATTTSVTGGGELPQTYTDTGAATAEAGGLTTPPTEQNALESPWEQNQYFIPALENALPGGITAVGDDASKPYPTDPGDQFGYGTPVTVSGTGSSTTCAPVACTPAGATFLEGTSAQVVPRHPINVFYNTSTDYQLLNEYQSIYGSDASVCAATGCTWANVIDQNVSGMFQFMMANDPRPSYVHQTNIMGTAPAGSEGSADLPPSSYVPQPSATPVTGGTADEPAGTGNPTSVGDGTLYQVLDPLIYEYNEYFNTNAPYEQLTEQQIATLLAQQSAWSANSASAAPVTGSIATGSNQVTLTNVGSPIETPLTGVPSVGSLYGGIQSGWSSIPTGTTTLQSSTTWPAYGAPVPLILPTAPVVSTGLATGISATAATLNGTVNGENNAITDCHFSWGTSTSYGNSVPCAGIPANGGTGAVTAALSGLSAGTTYHVQLVATNAAGPTDGSDVSFTTSGSATTGATVLSVGAPVKSCKAGTCTYKAATGALTTLGGKKPKGVVYLLTGSGTPITGSQVKIVDGKTTVTVKTGSKGTASFTLAVGKSRKITLSYAGTSTQPSASLTVSVKDVAYGTIKLTTKHLPASGPAAFDGKVVGANGKPAKLAVELQYLTSKNKWHTVKTVHSSAAGKWKASVSWPRKGHAGKNDVYYRVDVAGTASAQISARLP